MAIDMEQFRQVYLEESFEGLEIMESGLLELDPGKADSEEINTIFRAAHSIKVVLKIAGREAIEISVASACIFLVGVDCIMFAFDGSSTVRRDRWSASASVRVIPLVER
jgi:hypothetical protein